MSTGVQLFSCWLVQCLLHVTCHTKIKTKEIGETDRTKTMEGDESMLEILPLLLPDSKVYVKTMENSMAKYFLERSTRGQRSNTVNTWVCVERQAWFLRGERCLGSIYINTLAFYQSLLSPYLEGNFSMSSYQTSADS